LADKTPASEQWPHGQWRLFDPGEVAIYGDLYGRWFENIAKTWQEIAAITFNRLQQDTAAWVKLASCRNPRDFVEFQRSIALDTAAHVAEDTAKLSEKITSLWENSVTKRAA
jgi:hypothetical protein